MVGGDCDDVTLKPQDNIFEDGILKALTLLPSTPSCHRDERQLMLRYSSRLVFRERAD